MPTESRRIFWKMLAQIFVPHDRVVCEPPLDVPVLRQRKVSVYMSFKIPQFSIT